MTDYAAKRAARMARRLEDYQRQRAALTDVPEALTPWLAPVDNVIERHGADPVDVEMWRELAAAASALRHRAWQHFGNAGQADPYIRLRDAAEYTFRDAVEVAIVAEAGAPICREHGPATLVDADAELWRCAGGADCRSPYLWLDGTERHRGRR